VLVEECAHQFWGDAVMAPSRPRLPPAQKMQNRVPIRVRRIGTVSALLQLDGKPRERFGVALDGVTIKALIATLRCAGHEYPPR
jgi:hypothetical protein